MGTQASMDGQVPGDITYPDWLKRQSRERQVQALGKRRAEMYRAGEVGIGQFTDDRNRVLTITELRKIERDR